jgi:hypothetical protein
MQLTKRTELGRLQGQLSSFQDASQLISAVSRAIGRNRYCPDRDILASKMRPCSDSTGLTLQNESSDHPLAWLKFSARSPAQALCRVALIASV